MQYARINSAMSFAMGMNNSTSIYNGKKNVRGLTAKATGSAPPAERRNATAAEFPPSAG
jgi:hypothetical protein